MRSGQGRADLKTTARTFAAGAGCGFIAGALAAVLLLGQYGDALGFRRPSGQRSVAPRVQEPLDDAGPAVIEEAPGKPVATTSEPSPVAAPRPSPEPVIAAEPIAELAGRDLEIPVEGVRADQLKRTFSEDRGGRPHEAIDILAPRNTPVKAVESGKIARLFLSKAGGITIYQFDPSERYSYYYAHLERYADGLKEGQTVKRGQVIGYVGVSGNAPKDTPHLHFAVFRLSSEKRWWEGSPIDPYDILK